MSYTDVWSTSTPTGSEAANTIKTIIRNVKLDMQERLMDIFSIPDFTVDPLRPYGIKFTDNANSIISLGDNTGAARSLSIKNKAGSSTYVTFSDSPAITIVQGGFSIIAGNISAPNSTINTSVCNANLLDAQFAYGLKSSAPNGTSDYNLFIAGVAAITNGMTIKFMTATQRMAYSFLSGDITVNGGSVLLSASTTARSSLNVPTGVAPTTPNAGDVWREGSLLKFFDGSTTKTFTLS